MLCIRAVTTRAEPSPRAGSGPVKWYSEFNIDNPICYDCNTRATLFYLAEEQRLDGTYEHVIVPACEHHKLDGKISEFIGGRSITLDELMVAVTMEE